MKIKTLVCNQCGYERKIKTYSREEAERERIQLGSPQCEKCGSTDVRLFD